MKKVLSIILATLMVFCLSVTALAAPNGFIRSPGGNSAPTVDEFKPADEDCTADLVVTPYGDLASLPPEEQETFKVAYDTIINADDLTKLNSELEKQAKDKGIDPEDLAVSDLFDLGCTNCDDHDSHKNADITLKAETLEKFVGLMFMDDSGNWNWVDGATVNGNKLSFTATNTDAPYAIIVDNTKASAGTEGDSDNDPGTGEDNTIYVVGAVAIACVLALAIIFVVIFYRRKRKAN